MSLPPKASSGVEKLKQDASERVSTGGAPDTAKACFDFYGLRILVISASEEVIDHVRRDFSFFHVTEQGAQVVVEVRIASPPYAELPPAPATVFTPRNVSFRRDRITYIDYFGRGLVVFDRKNRRCEVYGTDLYLLREIVYLFILSTVGQYLDGRGLHRLHALAVSYRRHGILLVLPSGGGKSRLALELLREPGVRLLSEDTPLIDRRGHILPFHQPLGVRPDREADIPARYRRTVRRMEFAPKTLIDLDYFGDRIATEPAPADLLLIGERNLGDVSEIVPLSRFRAFNGLVRYMIVGLGVYQGLEFLLERGLWESLGKVGVATSRLWNSLILLSRARPYRFVLGRNHEKNRRTFVHFVSRRFNTER